MIGRVYRWRGHYWRVICRGEPFDRGPRRNVLLERVVRARTVTWHPQGNCYRWHWLATGERVCRPFRGLRRA
jgi:hypothetical protein